MSNLKHWIWLTQRKGLAGQNAVRVLERFGTPEQAHAADEEAYAQVGGLSQATIRSLMDKSLSRALEGHPPATHGAVLEGEADCL